MIWKFFDCEFGYQIAGKDFRALLKKVKLSNANSKQLSFFYSLLYKQLEVSV
jgi:hypothetical protein